VLWWGLLSTAALANLLYATNRSQESGASWREFDLTSMLVVGTVGALAVGSAVYLLQR
jgi:hypothetical protein